jgi:hypothetical protein
MPDETPSQSFSISGGQLSNIQIGGQAGRDLNLQQHQQVVQSKAEQPLTQREIVELLVQVEAIVRANLPPEQASKALKHLESVKEEAESSEPDRNFAAKSLQRATQVMKEANDTVEAGTNLWQKIEPLLSRLSPWLKVGIGFFL